MMEFAKRHAFLLVLGVGFVVIAAAVLVTVQAGYRGPGSKLETKLARTKGAAEALSASPQYGDKLIDGMSEEVKQRQARHEEILDYVRKLGHARKPLIEGLFPKSTDESLRHKFKAEYDPALDRLMKTLGASHPLLPEDTPEAEKASRLKKFEQATMFAHPQQSFVRPDWVDKAEAPTLDQCAVAQEDLWLMSDLVDILAAMNRDSPAVQPPVIRNVPIKELVEIRIGAGVATLEGSRGGAGGVRYLPSSAPAEGAVVPTLSGRLSKPGFYRVLPFRLAVVIESRRSGELLRRLKGTESFLSVDAWHMKPIVPEAFERFRGSLLASSREVYGNGGVVLLEVVGESLVFQLAGGRVTNPPQTAAGPEAPAKAG